MKMFTTSTLERIFIARQITGCINGALQKIIGVCCWKNTNIYCPLLENWYKKALHTVLDKGSRCVCAFCLNCFCSLSAGMGY